MNISLQNSALLFALLVHLQVGVMAADSEKRLGPPNPDAIEPDPFPAETAARIGKLRQLITQLTAAKGAEHEDTLLVREDLANRLFSAGKMEEALQERRELYATYARIFGPEASKSIGARGWLAYTLNYSGKLAEAEEIYQGLSAYYSKTNGAEDESTIRNNLELASVWADRGKFAEAERAFRAGIGFFERQKGDHLDLICKCCYNLAFSLLAQGKMEEALVNARRAEDGWKTKHRVGRYPAIPLAEKLRQDCEAALKKK